MTRSRARRIVCYRLLDGQLWIQDGLEVAPQAKADEVKGPIATTVAKARAVLVRTASAFERCEAAAKIRVPTLGRLVSVQHARAMRLVMRKLPADLHEAARADDVPMRALFRIVHGRTEAECRARWNARIFEPLARRQARSATSDEDSAYASCP